jgi:hypothetical protein
LVVEAHLADVEHQHGWLIEVAVQHAIRVELDRLGDLLVRTVLYSDEGLRMIFAALVSELGSEQRNGAWRFATPRRA